MATANRDGTRGAAVTVRVPYASSVGKNQALAIAVIILLVATALRLASLGQVPPGLYHDEAYNGLDALRVLDGDLSLYFAANNGREPLFIYWSALFVGLLGRNPIAVRLAATIPGLLTVAATYAMGRTLFTRRVGLLGAAVLSVTLWHVHLSRVGFRAVLLPLFLALAVWQAGAGWRTGRRRNWLFAGALYGLSFYTYIAARFSLVALVLYAAYLLLTRPKWRTRQAWMPVVWFGLATAATLVPLAVFTVVHPDLILARTGQVAIWNPEINDGDFWGTLARHTMRTLGMFFVRGDRIWRHNVPWRPIFDPLLGIFFLLGLGLALRNFVRDARMGFLVVSTGAMMLPTLLAEDAPHFLRAVGVLPLAVLFPALGMDWLVRAARTVVRDRQGAAGVAHYAPRMALIAVLSISLIATIIAYFSDYAHADETAYWFEDGAEALAGAVNEFLDSGWDGERVLHGESEGRQAYIDSSLWQEWKSVPFLVADSPNVQLLGAEGEWPTLGREPAAFFVWPYGNWRRVWSTLAGPVDVRVEEGELSQGDRDLEPFSTYRAFYIAPVKDAPLPVVRFHGGVELADVRLRSVDEGVRVELVWHPTALLSDDYVVFVHYLAGEERIAQDDAQPAGGHYPTSRWRVGDVVHDDHFMPLPGEPDPSHDQIVIGLYRSADGQPVDVLDGAGNPAGTFVTFPAGDVMR
jgi:4-amino-4-deoxy-L-arabinose transferase-like glycosyltransferase